jgi:Raf kinase inhibitor-like YbhB/YbcL family protein
MAFPRTVAPLLFTCALAFTMACGDDDSGTGSSNDDGGGAGGAGTGGSGGVIATGGMGGMGTGGTLPFTVTSTAFAEGDMIPLPHECGPPLQGPGMNLSPQLGWTPGPAETQSYAVVVRDVDAMIPQYPEGVIHWVIHDIPAATFELPEGVMDGYMAAAPAGALQANIQGSGFFGYFGTCSPNSVNTYVFTVHAMPTATVPGVTMQSAESEVAAAIESASIAQTALAGES